MNKLFLPSILLLATASAHAYTDPMTYCMKVSSSSNCQMAKLQSFDPADKSLNQYWKSQTPEWRKNNLDDERAWISQTNEYCTGNHYYGGMVYECLGAATKDRITELVSNSNSNSKPQQQVSKPMTQSQAASQDYLSGFLTMTHGNTVYSRSDLGKYMTEYDPQVQTPTYIPNATIAKMYQDGSGVHHYLMVKYSGISFIAVILNENDVSVVQNLNFLKMVGSVQPLVCNKFHQEELDPDSDMGHDVGANSIYVAKCFVAVPSVSKYYYEHAKVLLNHS